MHRLLLVTLCLATLAAAAACRSGGGDSTPTAAASEAATTQAPPTVSTPTKTLTAEPNSPAASTPAGAAAQAPTTGRWIDVDVTHFAVRLMDGKTATKTISPVAVGAQIDTGIYNSTATGLFHVYSKTAERTYDAPYNTYISNWVGFDPNLDNGFHSFLEDANGNVVDASTGHVSNGCIRTGDSAAIFSFAQIGMPVYVHT